MKRSSERPSVVFLAAAVLLVVLSNLTPISESDFWLQLKVGAEITATHGIPPTIEYAFTEARDLPFVAHEWLPSVATSALYPIAGYAGMIVFKCLLACGVVLLSFLLARELGADATVAGLIALAAATVMNFRFQMRPEIFAFLLAFGTTILLTRFAEASRGTGTDSPYLSLSPLPVIALVWANTHASITLGLLLPWIFLAGSAIDDLRAKRPFRIRTVQLPLAATGTAMALAALVNPYGVRLFVHAAQFSRLAYLRDNIVEFASTFGEQARHTPYFWAFVAYAAILIAVVAFRWRRLDGTALLLLALFGWMAADAIRFTAWLALAGTYAMGKALAGVAGRKLASAGTVLALLGIATVLARGDVRGHRVGFANQAPMSDAAIAFIRDHGIAGNVFNTFSHGDQLVFNFFPKIRVVIDSRIDAYGEGYYLKYRDLCGRSYKALGPPEDLVAYLARYDVRTIVTRPLDLKNWKDKGHVAALEKMGFSLVYGDATTAILTRGR
ncbi:MAG TPA: hypothetical protein VFV19_11450 [Candidatus Polarisedimenticolaceae bacterium]|nr:hypothetical protein [Candidatus Polarisedimenticolaceae bacterium]